jgi:molecular chaperone HtpG
VERLARLYGEFLPLPITVRRGRDEIRVTAQNAPFPGAAQPDGEGASPRRGGPGFTADGDYAQATWGFKPLATFPLGAPGSLTTGQAFVLPFAPPPAVRPTARVYLGRMLLSEKVEDLLPEWAFFVRAVVNSDGLTPTASREALVNDASLEYTREQFGHAIRSWLRGLAVHNPMRLGAFLHVHEAAIKQLILHDDEMAGVFLGWLTVETSQGTMRVEDLVRRSPRIRYARTIDEFSQIAPLMAKDTPLVNGGYVYDSELCELIPSVYPQARVERVDVLSELDRLDPPSLGDRTVAVALEDRASAVLASRECRAVVRVIEDEDVPALFVADPEVFRHIDRGRASAVAGAGLWRDLLAQADALAREHAGAPDADGFASRLCLNWGNPIIRSLATVADSLVFDRCVRLLYVQSQLAGHRPLSGDDRALMTTALTDLIALSTAHEPTP